MKITVWSKIYKKKNQINIWPWSKLIQFIKRNNLTIKNKKVLEVGFGTGNNIPFFLYEKTNYLGIEQSNVAFNIVKRKYNKKKVVLFNDNILNFNSKKKIDLIIDRGTLSCNDHDQQKKIIKKYFSLLKKDGHICCIDIFKSISKNSKLSKYTFPIKKVLIKDLKNLKVIDYEEVLTKSKNQITETINLLIKK
jgi:SAM-dependent methyltransferase